MKIKKNSSIACVVPRYGASIGGGAETLVRELVCNSLKTLFETVEVWTTCAQDHRSWENSLKQGKTIEDDVEVHRFRVDERNLESFINFELAMQDGRSLSLDEQFLWLENGVNSKDLYSHIAKHGSDFDYIMFAPYLFPTSVWGAMIYPEKSIMIPCLHDEQYAYLEVFRSIFSNAKGLFFNAKPEMELASKIYNIEEMDTKSFVIGMGFDSQKKQIDTDLEKNDIPFILYTGRKETGKGLDLLINCFSNFKKENPNEQLELCIIGSGSIDFLEALPEGVVDKGFVSEEEKNTLMSNCLALCQPSVNESFSIVLMESWLQLRPVIVNKACAVTSFHVEQSGGGYSFEGSEEFNTVLKKLLSDTSSSIEMGKLGEKYVKEKYSWSAVTSRLTSAFSTLEHRSS